MQYQEQEGKWKTMREDKDADKLGKAGKDRKHV